MRPIELAFGLLAGAAVNLILIPVRRRRRRRRNRQALPAPPRHRVLPTRPHHVAILARLDVEAPLIKASHYAQTCQDSAFDCTFCLDPILAHPHAELRVTKCAHVFHAQCLESWVIYTADICLDWNQYTVAEDGRIVSQVRVPTCPNCTADLDVIPDELLRATVLTAVARSLSLRDLSVAAEMYNAGVVYREGTQRTFNSSSSLHTTERRVSSPVSTASSATERLPRRYSANWLTPASATPPQTVERSERIASSSAAAGSAERPQRRTVPTWPEPTSSHTSRHVEYDEWRSRASPSNVTARGGEPPSTGASEAVAFVPAGIAARRALSEVRVGLGIASRVALQATS